MRATGLRRDGVPTFANGYGVAGIAPYLVRAAGEVSHFAKCDTTWCGRVVDASEYARELAGIADASWTRPYLVRTNHELPIPNIQL